jgi:hypothetical protein
MNGWEQHVAEPVSNATDPLRGFSRFAIPLYGLTDERTLKRRQRTLANHAVLISVVRKSSVPFLCHERISGFLSDKLERKCEPWDGLPSLQSGLRVKDGDWLALRAGNCAIEDPLRL